MRPTRLIIALLSLPVAVWAADPKPDEMVNNPPFANWSMFEPGTTVSQQETVTLADGSKVQLTKTLKLVSKSKDQVVVESTVKQSGGGAVESETTATAYPAKVKRKDVDTPDDASATVTEGKETVDFKGKKIEAEWVEATVKEGESSWTEKIWTAKDVPGGIVKQTLTEKKGGKVVSESLLEVVETK